MPGPLKNSRREKFCQELTRGMSQADAYAAAGYSVTAGAKQSGASGLLREPEVAERVAELKGQAAEKAVLDKAWVLQRLMANAERAAQAEEVKDREGNATGEFKYDGAVVNRALELIGKELGMFVDRSDVTQKVQTITDEPLSPEEWAALHVTEH
jgi:phage terminase small subunit